MKAPNAKKSRALGIALLALGLAALALAIVFNVIKYYPFGSKSWILGAVTGVLILLGAVLSFRESYAKMAFAKKTGLWGVIFLLPWILGFGLFFLIPMARELFFSFENVSIRPTGGLDEEFVKLANYHYILLEHPTYVRQLTETVL
ncbi:MAG: sugar ABC transporter permease, partial [Clostridia bacterium]|nr:sugar ABC transporter permease [Clostridia bacterium]